MKEDNNFNRIEESILSTLLYFGMFEHPLKANEVWIFNQTDCSLKEVQMSLSDLVERGFLYQEGSWYTVSQQKDFVPQLARLNAKSQRKLRNAYKFARALSKLPFVRSIALSGDLAKGVSKGFKTIDFSFIVKENRMWIAYLCINTFLKVMQKFSWYRTIRVSSVLEENNLELEDKSLSTAIDVMTLVPLYNTNELLSILKANSWIKRYFPNQNWKKILEIQIFEGGVFSKIGIIQFLKTPLSWVNSLLKIYFLKISRKQKTYSIGKKHQNIILNRSDKKINKRHHLLLKQYGIKSLW